MSFDFRIRNGDWFIGTNGDAEKVEKLDKLQQDVLKICLTKVGSNPNNKAYGSLFGNSIGNVLDPAMLAVTAGSQLKSSIELLKKLQELQAEYQYVSPEESIASIQNVSVQQNTSDPRYYAVEISIINKALQRKIIDFTVGTPNL